MAIGIKDIADAFEVNGGYHYSYVFKTAIATPQVAGGVVDMSMSGGVPKYNAYVGAALEATPMFGGSGNVGINTGAQPAAGFKKRLLTARVRTIHGSPSTTFGSTLMLLDYLMFYPLVDLDDTAEQFFDNTETLPRYEDGVGLQMFMTCTIPTTSNAVITLNYINSADESKSTTFTVAGVFAGSVCSGLSTFQGFFIPPADGKGVKRVTSVQLASPAGGLASLVICKPLTSLTSYEMVYDSEITLINDKMTFPEIKNGAYLNFLSTVPVVGSIQFYSELLFVDVPQ